MKDMDKELSPDACDAIRRLDGRMFIGGQWTAAAAGDTREVLNPADGTAFMTVPEAKEEDVEQAVASAKKALAAPEWADMRPSHRQRLLLHLADALSDARHEMAELEALDNGKPVTMAEAIDVRGAVEFLRYMAGWATKIEGRTLDVSFPAPRGGGLYHAFTRREPVGVVGAIIPWNYPLSMAVWKLGPALATGCTVVLKPASETPLTALRLAELAQAVGVPPGVVNVITGSGSVAGAALSEHRDVDKVAFTGSTEVGRTVGHAAMDRMAHVSLELGGKSPMLLFADANLKAAIPGTANAIFANAGQTCTAGSRLYVERPILDQVVEGVCARSAKLRMGRGLDPETQLGPLVSERQRMNVADYVEIGRSEGAEVVAGGAAPDGEGFFYQPTVLTGMAQSSRVVQEEIFGPVLCILPFDDPEEAIALANDSPYGLSASIWSGSLSTVHRLTPRLRAGTVWVNTHNMIDPNLPFGGTKLSGIGREMGRSVIEAYAEEKSVLMSV